MWRGSIHIWKENKYSFASSFARASNFDAFEDKFERQEFRVDEKWTKSGK